MQFKYLLLLVAWAIMSVMQSVFAQHLTPDPDSILVGDRQQPSIFLVGCFHFAYYNFDAHKVSKDDQVDILSPQKQKEMEELLEYLYLFKPTKIAIESDSNTGYLLRRYERWKRGEHPLGKDEIEQIGFRLMDKFSLDTLYGVNANTLVHDLLNSKDSLAFRPVLDSIYEDWDFRNEDPVSKRYSTYYTSNDGLATKMTLLEYFKYTNTDKILDRGFGSYLNGDFTLGDLRGADALAMHWYNRNLRIYRKIQQITTSPSDRILVIFGRGHIEILKHLFECSPQYNLVKFDELESRGK